MTFLYILIGLVLVFDFINGFHDSANSIASTGWGSVIMGGVIKILILLRTKLIISYCIPANYNIRAESF